VRGVLSLLGRNDKEYVGGGNRLLYAPPFPFFSDTPGFWDPAHYYNYEIPRLFTWTLLDEAGKEIPLRYVSRHWNPARLTRTYRSSPGGIVLSVAETRTILANDVALAQLRIRLPGRTTRRIHLVAWTVFENFPAAGRTWIAEPECGRGVFGTHLYAGAPGRPPVKIATALALDRKTSSYAVQLSEGVSPLPRWDHSPMEEKFRKGRLPDTVRPTGVTDDGLLFAALHTELPAGGGREVEVTIALAAAPAREEARSNVRRITRQRDPVAFSDHSWNDYFSGVPRFSCSDPFIERYYWYRWYGLRLNTLAGGEGHYRFPVVCEGIGYFRAPISYSAPCHMLENRWRHDPELARGSLRTFIDNQRDDGGFRGYIDLSHVRPEMFYHARWGRALTALQAVHPSASFLREAYGGLATYARYFDRERDPENSGLYDIDNHYETGQEYMRRYTVVNADADRDNWGEVFRLKGVDATVYIYELKRALAAAARDLGLPSEAARWDQAADSIRRAVRTSMWDPEQRMFFDVDPATGRRTGAKAVTCFYPYLTDIVSGEHLEGLKQHLLNPREFWSPSPVPSSSMDDAMFDDEPEWKGKRMNCPWNGRVWPMTNSHVAEILASAALAFDDRALRTKTAEFIRRYIRMMFFDGDPARPNSFEHYNPISGKPGTYRGIDDYQHSWVVDLIISYVCGLRPGPDGIVVDPFPFGLKHVSLDGVFVQDRRFRIDVTGGTVSVWIDGKRKASGPLGTSIRIDPEH
jgi:hypothetical protein